MKKFRWGEYCCVPGCSNQYADDKIRGIKRSYYKFLDRTICKNATLAAIKLEQKRLQSQRQLECTLLGQYML